MNMISCWRRSCHAYKKKPIFVNKQNQYQSTEKLFVMHIYNVQLTFTCRRRSCHAYKCVFVCVCVRVCHVCSCSKHACMVCICYLNVYKDTCICMYIFARLRVFIYKEYPQVFVRGMSLSAVTNGLFFTYKIYIKKYLLP